VFPDSENKRDRVKTTGPTMFLYHDEEYKETDADIEIVLPVSGRTSVEDPQMEVKTLLIKAVFAVYRGSYYRVETAYFRIFSFAKENLEPFSPSRELYFNGPAKVSEEELMTEVLVVVENFLHV
jgi:effector-binding domain-containing protein